MNTDNSASTAYVVSVNPSQNELYDLGSSSASSLDSNFNDKDNSSITASSVDQKTILSNLCPDIVNLKKPIIGKKTYPCPECLKSFSRPSALETHSYTHTSEKPFQCHSPGCGRRFSVVSNLRRHFKIHKKSSSDKISSEDRRYYVRQLIEKKEKHLSLRRQQNSFNAYEINDVTDNTIYAPFPLTTTLEDNYHYYSQDIMGQTHHHVEDYAPQSKQRGPLRPVPRPYNATGIQSNVDSNDANRLHNNDYKNNRHFITEQDFNMKKFGLGTKNDFLLQASMSDKNLPVSWFGRVNNFSQLSGGTE